LAVLPRGSLVIYFHEADSFAHVGLVREGGRVESKWGQLGLFEHELFEVPSNYGNNVRFFDSLPFMRSIAFFYDFAEEKGVEFEDDVP
jgi:hypothetical protein